MQQFNPIRFFTDKRATQFEKTPDNIESMVFYEIGVVPAFCLLVATNPDDPAPTFSGKVYDAEDNEIYTLADSFVSGKDTYSQIIYAGINLTGKVKGYYYLKVTIGTTDYFSDMFAWIDITAELLKFEVATSDVRVNDNLLYMMDGVSSTFYLNAEQLSIKPKIDQVGHDQKAITNILFGSRAVPREFEIDASESIFIYLSALGLLKSNGSVQITWKYETWNASDILVEETTFHGNGLYQVKLTFVDEDESVSICNG